MRLEGWGCHFPLGMAPSPACTRGVRSSVCSWAGVDMYSRDPIAPMDGVMISVGGGLPWASQPISVQHREIWQKSSG
jgi:hypothetical protein